MSDLISREELKKTAKRVASMPWGDEDGNRIEFKWTSEELEALIDKAPSVEPKKGKWIFARYFVWECSECGKNPTRGMGYTQRRDELFRYCPYCGASMEVTE